MSGTPVVITSSTSTAQIPTTVNCTGSTVGSAADLPVVNTPLYSSGGAHVTSMRLKYDMSSFIGEPTRKAVIGWSGSGSLYNVSWLAEVHNKNGAQYVTGSGNRVFASYIVGTVPKPDAGFGWDTTGSPSWSQVFVTYAPSAGTTFGVTANEAKAIYSGCFKLANVKVFKLDDKPALTK